MADPRFKGLSWLPVAQRDAVYDRVVQQIMQKNEVVSDTPHGGATETAGQGDVHDSDHQPNAD